MTSKHLSDKFTKNTYNINQIFINCINEQKNKESKMNIWKNSMYKHLIKLKSNNVGIVGEMFMQEICNICNIECYIDGTKTKEIGGGIGDGVIMNKSIEIKTAHIGTIFKTFQHELGESPWISNVIIFIDVDIDKIYLTIFKNFAEYIYKNGKKCDPIFPSKKITWRKKSAAFKLDTSVKINKENVLNGYCFIIDENTDTRKIKEFIIKSIT